MRERSSDELFYVYKQLIENRSLLEKLAGPARHSVKNCSWDYQIENWEYLHKSAVFRHRLITNFKTLFYSHYFDLACKITKQTT